MLAARRHGTKADIYSFGVTLLEMARGKVPFAGMPLEVVAMNKLHHPSPSLPSTYEGRQFSQVCTQPTSRPTAGNSQKATHSELSAYRVFSGWLAGWLADRMLSSHCPM